MTYVFLAVDGVMGPFFFVVTHRVFAGSGKVFTQHGLDAEGRGVEVSLRRFNA